MGFVGAQCGSLTAGSSACVRRARPRRRLASVAPPRLGYHRPVEDDATLLAHWRTGDSGAGDELLRRHFATVVRFFRSKLGDDIDDIVQQTFADTVRARDQVGEGGFRAYLLRVAHNRLMDDLRRKARRPEAFDPGSISLADIATSVSQRIARNQDEHLMLVAMRELSVDFQIALELAYWEELPGQEIAVILGISPHTVRSRLARARVALREALERQSASPALIEQSVARLEFSAAQRQRAGAD